MLHKLEEYNDRTQALKWLMTYDHVECFELIRGANETGVVWVLCRKA